ncbi:hypothetical protein HanIR_Chr10g0468671 [Helianthus annuus]|nr:hypothetical protein HanIR_Chr10g0468671 [Helianthus annuus]
MIFQMSRLIAKADVFLKIDLLATNLNSRLDKVRSSFGICNFNSKKTYDV